jgi:hypothetical protein
MHLSLSLVVKHTTRYVAKEFCYVQQKHLEENDEQWSPVRVG